MKILDISLCEAILFTEFHQAFILYDKDFDGAINPRVLGNVMRTLGQNPTEDELKSLINEFDCDGSRYLWHSFFFKTFRLNFIFKRTMALVRGFIEFEEFLQMMIKRSNQYDEEDELTQAFRVFDKNGDGFIRVSELK